MAYLTISPIEITTVGGYPGEILGIDPASSDCLVGRLNTTHGGPASWDIRGQCRDQSNECNIDLSSEGFVEAERLALALVKPEYL